MYATIRMQHARRISLQNKEQNLLSMHSNFWGIYANLHHFRDLSEQKYLKPKKIVFFPHEAWRRGFRINFG